MYQKAIYTFNTTPYKGKYNTNHIYWLHNRFDLYFFYLSVEASKILFPWVEILTDSYGESILNSCGFKFNKLSTALDEIQLKNKLWCHSKVLNFSIQECPFIHIDCDAMFRNSLENKYSNSNLLFQSKDDYSLYEPYINKCISILNYFPSFLNNNQLAVNMGIYGVNDLNFNKEYCKEFMRFYNYNDWNKVADTFRNLNRYNMVAEQFLMGALLNKFNITPKFLLDNSNEINNKIGYVHIWGGKKDKDLLDKIEKRINLDFPEIKSRIDNYFF